MFRKILPGVAIVVLTASTASGADLAFKTKAPAAAPIKFTWTGCYLGGHVGGVVSEVRRTNNLGNSADTSSNGFVGGGQIGCDYQFASNWVVGAEGRAAWTSLDQRETSSVRFAGLGGLIVPSQLHSRNDFLASATARLGYVYAERWLVYARGGAAWTREKVDDAFVSPNLGIPTDPSATVNRTGWTAGGGVEWAFAPHWSANVEYNYYDFGTKSVVMTGSANSVTIAGYKDAIHAATIGVNYRF